MARSAGVREVREQPDENGGSAGRVAEHRAEVSGKADRGVKNSLIGRCDSVDNKMEK